VGKRLGSRQGGLSQHSPTPDLALPGSPHPASHIPCPMSCLQAHKFLHRNRDHLDPAVVEMLGQSQLQVLWQPSRLPVHLPPSCPCPPILLPKGLVPGTPDSGLSMPGSGCLPAPQELAAAGGGVGRPEMGMGSVPSLPCSWWAACSREQSPWRREGKANPHWPLAFGSPWGTS
jgi:hypothetical protein